MPVDTKVAMSTWNRYAYARDNGHTRFVEKADTCDAFFRGDQWSASDKAMLREHRRPALTINKIMSTVANVLGEQIQNRNEVTYRPKDGAPPETAETLAKVLKHIGEVNQLDWKRSDMFADGMITSRGFLDMRMTYDESMRGDIAITKLNPKNVVVDPDADDLDPDTWNEVFTTKWATSDDIAVLYSKEDADILKGRGVSDYPYGYDSIDRVRDRFGERFASAYGMTEDDAVTRRNLRIVDHQHRVLHSQRFLVDPRTGDMRAIPDEWDRNRVAAVKDQFKLVVTKKQIKRIKWTVCCDSVVLHDEWSPYKHFTVIPFFPYFRHGRTIGMVEHLLDPQDLLNKTLSQELHVINTTANSGWVISTGKLLNMSVSELEARGSQTGVVLEVEGPAGEAAQKIQPNQVPTGLDRLSFKAEEHINGISGVSDSARGMDRADVAAKAIQQKRQANSTNLVKPFDSLARSDFILARNALDLIQENYTDERVLTITHDKVTNTTEDMPINQVQPDGSILNDLTLGTYAVVISSVPQRETLEDSQFDQAVSLRELGIKIPDETVIESSRLMNKGDIIKKMQAEASTPEAQREAQLTLDGKAAEVEKTKAETARYAADAGLKAQKSGETQIKSQRDLHTPIEQGEGPQAVDPSEVAKNEQEMNLALDKHEHDKEMDRKKLEITERESQAKQALAQQAEADKALERRQSAARERTQPTQPKE